MSANVDGNATTTRLEVCANNSLSARVCFCVPLINYMANMAVGSDRRACVFFDGDVGFFRGVSVLYFSWNSSCNVVFFAFIRNFQRVLVHRL